MYLKHGFSPNKQPGLVLHFTDSCCHFIECGTVDYEYTQCNFCFNVEAVMTAHLLKEKLLHISCVKMKSLGFLSLKF